MLNQLKLPIGAGGFINMKLFDGENFIHQLSIDCVIFGYKEKELKVLVPKIKLSKELWALPGGFIQQDESIDEAAQRILQERTGLRDIYLEQYRVFGQTERKNNEIFEEFSPLKTELLEQLPFNENDINWLKQRFVSIGYYALVDINKVNPQKGNFDDSIDWYNIKDLPTMIMDHNEMVSYALETLRQNLTISSLALIYCPKLSRYEKSKNSTKLFMISLLQEIIFKRKYWIWMY